MINLVNLANQLLFLNGTTSRISETNLALMWSQISVPLKKAMNDGYAINFD